ncbi:PP2C family protein-serine/threonine phosphatase [Streptomyces sp. NPDC001941]|uniref:PP2C family protein-serine/threonine phosphatase n=1 Tax=Streptomyces sp. NPDC001941 TaxID=3154659 RepID=UPI00331A9700
MRTSRVKSCPEAATAVAATGAPAPEVVPAPRPMVSLNSCGRLVSLNPSARELFPGARPGQLLSAFAPAWLVRAHVRRTGLAARDACQPVRGHLGGRTLDALPGYAPDGSAVWWLVDASPAQLPEDSCGPESAAEALADERERTRLLEEVSGQLRGPPDVRTCTTTAIRLAAEHLADAAMVVGAGGGHSRPVTWCVRGGEPVHGRLALDTSELPALDEALHGLPTPGSAWLDPGLLPSWAVPDDFAGTVADIGSVLVERLPGHGRAMGALVLLRRRGRAGFDAGEEAYAAQFAARVGAALETTRLHSQQAQLVSILMPDLGLPLLERAQGTDFSGRRRGHTTSITGHGDFCVVYPAATEDGESLAVLGDVALKDMEGIVVASRMRNSLDALLPFADDHEHMLTLLNRALLAARPLSYATLVLVSVGREGAHTRLRVTNAGHPSPHVLRADGEVEEVRGRGTAVGALPDIKVTTTTTTLAPGETLLLHTSAVTQAQGGPVGDEPFDDEGLRAGLAECAGLPAYATTERVLMLASQWAGRTPHGDMALLAVSARHGAHLSAVDGHTRGRYTPS